MANWLGGGLSQITGQISNFTREVLTEGTEEIDDAPTALKLAKNRIQELEAICINQKSEVEKYKRVSDELTEKLESAELQISAISSEYRGIVEQKEVQLKELKQQQNELLEYQSKLLESSITGSEQKETFQPSSNIPEFEGDNHDFGDVISFQHEINRLRSEVQRLDSECSHWKRVATSSSHDSESTEIAASHADLQNQIKELKQRLSDEIDEHQRELSTLQDVHSQKVATLKKKQKDEVARLKDEIKDLQESQTGDLTDSRIQQLEDVNHKLSLDLDQTNAADREKSRLLEDLKGEITQKSDRIDKLNAENETLRKEKVRYLDEIDALTDERQTLKLQLNNANQHLKDASEIKSQAPGQPEVAPSSGPLTSTPIGKGKARPSEEHVEEFARLSAHNRDLEEKMQGLQEEVDEFELVRSDWQLEKEALEDVLIKMRQQLQEKDEQLSSAAGQENTKRSDTEVDDLVKAVEEARKDAVVLEKEKTKVVQEKEKALVDLEFAKKEIKQLEQYSKEKEKEICDLSGNLPAADNADLTLELENEKQRYQTLESEKQELEQSLEELDSQHQEALAQIILSRNKLQKSNEELKMQLDEKKAELVAVIEASESEASSQEKAAQLQEKMSKLQDQLLDLIKQIQLLEAEKIKIEVEAEETREKAKEAALALNDLHMDKRELETKVNSVQKELATCKEKVLKLSIENSEMQVRLNEYSKEEDNKHTSGEEEGDELSRILEESRRNEVKVLELENRLSSVEKFETKLKTEAEDSRGKVRGLETEVEKIRSCLEQERKDHENALIQQRLNLEAELARANENRDRLSQTIEEKTKEIDKLSVDLITQQKVSRDFESKLQSAQATIEELAELKKGMDEDVESLRHQYSIIVKEKELLESQLKSKAAEMHDISAGADQLNPVGEENVQLQKAVESLTQQLQIIQGKFQKQTDKNKQSLESNAELESRIVELETDVASRDAEIARQTNEISSLQQESNEKTEAVAKAKESIEALENKLNSTPSQVINDVENLSNGETGSKNSNLVKQNGGLREHYQNGDVNMTINEDEKEKLADLQKAISEKDKVIGALNDTNSSMLKLLEERSIAAHGDRSLVDIHHLQTQIKSLQVEKEQILSILNEKSRENGKLKSENHKLMNVVSQQKGALSKLQEDNRELSTSQSEAPVSPNQEMTKEAIKKLSQIIRDKDMEIEALGQKNQTLLQVLQESSQEGAQMASLMQERDNLSKQILAFQNDREQIIAALNAKHQEAVAYHAEVQRLSALVSMETEKQEKIQQEYSNLVQQYEDKQRALLKTQNELVNYKQKYIEVDNRYKEILNKSKLPEKVILNTEEGTNAAEDSAVSTEQAQTLRSSLDSNAQSQEIEDLKAIIQSHEFPFAEKDKYICDKENVIQERDRTIMLKDRQLSEKEREIGELRTKLGRSEDASRTLETECQSYKKQFENATFQLQGVQNELLDLRKEREQLDEANSVTQQEIAVIKEANNKLSMTVYDKDFEINALKDKVNTLTKIVQEAGEGEKGEMDRLMKETEAVQQQVQMFKQDRDQAFLALQQQQSENQQLRNEIQKLQEKEEKLVRELDRLRSHLLQIEDGYTQEALQAEEREKELRNRLAAAEERALSSSSAVENVNLQASAHVEALQQQVHQLAEQRDNAVMHLASVQETSNQYATSLANLQMVLEQFQMEKELQQAAEVEKLQKLLKQKEQEMRSLKDEMHQMQMQLDDTNDALEAAQRLSEQLDKKEEMISALREEVQLRENELKKSEEDIEKLTTNKEGKVDKIIVKNLVLGYFHTPSKKRREALQVIAQVLGFSTEEMHEIVTEEGSGWLGMFKRVTSTPSTPSTPKKQSGNGSFSQLFVSFLEKESSPQPELRLPAEKMVREQQERQQQQRNKPAFNPFATPAMHSQVPLQVRDHSTGSDDHLLMKPLSPSLPVFQPFAGSERTLTPPVGGAGPGHSSGRTSAESSGRSTPASSGAILRDVLLQQ